MPHFKKWTRTCETVESRFFAETPERPFGAHKKKALADTPEIIRLTV